MNVYSSEFLGFRKPHIGNETIFKLIFTRTISRDHRTCKRLEMFEKTIMLYLDSKKTISDNFKSNYAL